MASLDKITYKGDSTPLNGFNINFLLPQSTTTLYQARRCQIPKIISFHKRTPSDFSPMQHFPPPASCPLSDWLALYQHMTPFQKVLYVDGYPNRRKEQQGRAKWRGRTLWTPCNITRKTQRISSRREPDSPPSETKSS